MLTSSLTELYSFLIPLFQYSDSALSDYKHRHSITTSSSSKNGRNPVHKPHCFPYLRPHHLGSFGLHREVRSPRSPQVPQRPFVPSQIHRLSWPQPRKASPILEVGGATKPATGNSYPNRRHDRPVFDLGLVLSDEAYPQLRWAISSPRGTRRHCVRGIGVCKLKTLFPSC